MVLYLTNSYYFILARIADLLSVFWNRARISCLTSSGVNSCASGPLPSHHLSSMSLRLDPKIRNNSLNFCHRFTNWWTLPGSYDKQKYHINNTLFLPFNRNRQGGSEALNSMKVGNTCKTWNWDFACLIWWPSWQWYLRSYWYTFYLSRLIFTSRRLEWTESASK
jgi:hypothetical protein